MVERIDFGLVVPGAPEGTEDWLSYLRISDHATLKMERSLVRGHRQAVDRRMRRLEEADRISILAWVEQGDWLPGGILRRAAPVDRLQNAAAGRWLREQRILTQSRVPGSMNSGMELGLDALEEWLVRRFSPPNPMADELGLDPESGGFLGRAEAWVRQFTTGRIRDDFRWNIRGLIFNALRGFREFTFRISSRAVPRVQAERSARSRKVNRNVVRLTTESHPRATLRGGMARAAEQVFGPGKGQFMVYSPVRVDKGGATGGLLYRILSHAQLRKTYANVKGGSSFAGLGLHHGSREYYIPIPPGLESSASAWADQARRLFLDRGFNFEDPIESGRN